MNSEDVRNDPRMKAHWNKLARDRRMVNICAAGSLVVFAMIVLLACVLAGCRWPIIIKGGGSGGGEGSTVESGK